MDLTKVASGGVKDLSSIAPVILLNDSHRIRQLRNEGQSFLTYTINSREANYNSG